MLDLTTRNDAKRRAATCGYAEGVDGINTSSTPHQSVHDAWRRRYLLTKKVHIARLGEAKVGTSLRI
jgi:hypothetical protein